MGENISSSNSTFDTAAATSDTQLLVHYFKLYRTQSPTRDDDLSYLDCLSLRSVLKNLKPDQVMIHTNVIDYWPLDSCSELVTNWTAIHLKYFPRRFVMQGRRIRWLHHEADMAKLSVLRQYGGLTLDFDVYIINGTEVRRLLNTAPCIICAESPYDKEGYKVNAGFFGCLHKEKAQYPALVRKLSYDLDYRPDSWVYNSGIKAMEILKGNPLTATLVDNVCNNPPWANISSFMDGRTTGGWSYRPAFHTYFHDRKFNETDVLQMESSAGDLFRWILEEEDEGDEASSFPFANLSRTFQQTNEVNQ
ncbi:hypothetical protein RvY_08342 [Ramazzottius varieornatus]|uniref:Alpha-1,4-N-acetylglucosaminyltransferase n=1 Tax=Ramazzottius varieornatus TaxID=947166 RepID=A0A1D1V5H8_RAMVA|nr:hypothetical protein RvY_08342 [Ramazzottius varieornatus]